MKAAAGISGLLFLALGLSAQTVTRSFGSVVFPGGTSATTPGITRNFGNVVFPGSSAAPTVRTGPAPAAVGTIRAGRPVASNAGITVIHPPFNGNRGFNNNRGFNGNRGRTSNSLVYAYPVFVGNYYDSNFAASEPEVPMPAQVAPASMNMYGVPNEPIPARPAMIQVAPDYPPQMSVYQPRPAVEEPPAQETEHYLLAFKDHTVYSAVAYWFDGETLHYFTNGSTHNQASVSLLDKELTVRLNKEMGVDFHIPGAK
jgi:hypothetical protein